MTKSFTSPTGRRQKLRLALPVPTAAQESPRLTGMLRLRYGNSQCPAPHPPWPVHPEIDPPAHMSQTSPTCFCWAL